MRTSQIKSFKSNFIAIGWHFSALFVINSLLMALDCNKQLRHYCTRAYYKEYAFFSLAKIYLNLLKSRFSRELYLFITIAKDAKLKTRENETVEPLGTYTSLIRTPLHYGQLPMSQQNFHIFSLKKPL